MERLVLFLISAILFGCSHLKPSVVYNRAKVEVKNSGGVCYVDGQTFSGSLIEYTPLGDTLSWESYINGKEHGAWKKFYVDGKKSENRYFVDGKKEGEFLAWWPDGFLKFQYHFKNGEYNGALKEWDEYGNLLKESTYKAGYEEGLQKAWYPNGKIRSNYVMIKGRRYGLLGTKNCVNVSDSIFTAR